MPAQRVEAALVEKWSVPPDRARLLARLSHGSLGWAVSAINDGSLERHHEIVDEMIDVAGGDLETRFACAAQMATEFGQSRERVQQKLGLWLDWWHDVLLVKTGLGDATVNVDRLAALTDAAAELGLGQIRSCIESLNLAREQLKQNANARLTLEVFMLSLPVTAKTEQVTGSAGARRPAAAGR
jgi:DNA polymerase-3 subunit delta'